MGDFLDIVTIWRFLNTLLCLLALITVIIDFNVRHKNFYAGEMFFFLTICGLLTSAIIGSVEGIIQHNPVGFRMALVTASASWCVIGVFVSRRRRNHLYSEREV